MIKKNNPYSETSSFECQTNLQYCSTRWFLLPVFQKAKVLTPGLTTEIHVLYFPRKREVVSFYLSLKYVLNEQLTQSDTPHVALLLMRVAPGGSIPL